jgi:hypothetical protein
MSHVQIGASYGFGITEYAKYVNLDGQNFDSNIKNNYWTITAAYLF